MFADDAVDGDLRRIMKAEAWKPVNEGGWCVGDDGKGLGRRVNNATKAEIDAKDEIRQRERGASTETERGTGTEQDEDR